MKSPRHETQGAVVRFISPFHHNLLYHQDQTQEDNDRGDEKQGLMDRTRRTHKSSTSTAISLIASLLTTNGNHFTAVSLLGRHLHAGHPVQNTAAGASCLMHVIYSVHSAFFNHTDKVGGSYVCVADVQHHQTKLAVLILVQFMYQLSVVSLQHKEAVRLE